MSDLNNPYVGTSWRRRDTGARSDRSDTVDGGAWADAEVVKAIERILSYSAIGTTQRHREDCACVHAWLGRTEEER